MITQCTLLRFGKILRKNNIILRRVSSVLKMSSPNRNIFTFTFLASSFGIFKIGNSMIVSSISFRQLQKFVMENIYIVCSWLHVINHLFYDTPHTYSFEDLVLILVIADGWYNDLDLSGILQTQRRKTNKNTSLWELSLNSSKKPN